MSIHDLKPDTPEEQIASGESPKGSDDFEKSLELGEQVLGLITDVIDLARMEATLALKSIPGLLMLWFLMMPIILLTWCSFSVWIAWMVYAVTLQPGVGLFVFFMQQLLLLFVCRWLYVKYEARMTLPHTREHISKFLRRVNNEPREPGTTKKYPVDGS